MTDSKLTADENIRLRAKTPDRELIDQAAALLGTTRSQFMLSSALSAAKNVLLDQTTIVADTQAFNRILDWMDRPASDAELAGMKQLQATALPWVRDGSF